MEIEHQLIDFGVILKSYSCKVQNPWSVSILVPHNVASLTIRNIYVKFHSLAALTGSEVSFCGPDCRNRKVKNDCSCPEFVCLKSCAFLKQSTEHTLWKRSKSYLTFADRLQMAPIQCTFLTLFLLSEWKIFLLRFWIMYECRCNREGEVSLRGSCLLNYRHNYWSFHRE